MGRIVSRTAYKMVADLIEEFLADTGIGTLHREEVESLEMIRVQMERRGSRKHPYDNWTPETRPEPVRPSTPRRERPPTTVNRLQEVNPTRPLSKAETLRIYREAQERFQRQREALKPKPAIVPGVQPPWL
jgi:hypothetical protein